MLKVAKHFVNELEFSKDWAELQTTCKRKGVGCSLHHWEEDKFRIVARKHNGPSRKGHPCTNVVGGCGCSHSEPRVIIDAKFLGYRSDSLVMVCTYSPCTNCANIIIDSRVVKGIVWDILTEHDKRGAEFLRSAMDVITKAELLHLLQFADDPEREKTFVTLERWCSSGPKLDGSA